MRRLLPAVTGALGTGLLAAALLPVGAASAGPGSGDAVIERVSVDSDGTQGNRNSYGPVLSRNGRYVAFVSLATNLAPPYQAPPGGGVNWMYVRDLRDGSLARVNYDGAAETVYDFSASGNEMLFRSSRGGLYVRDLTSTDIERVDVELGDYAGGGAYDGRISGDGRYVVFTQTRPGTSTAREGSRVYVRDLREGTTQWVSGPNTASEEYSAGRAAISDDGQRVAYVNTRYSSGRETGNAYLFDRRTGDRQLLDVSQSGPTPERSLGTLSLSADGGRVLFNRSDASPVTADDQGSNVFVRDLDTGTTRPIPATATETGADYGKLSPDGRFAVYVTRVGGPDTPQQALVRRDLETGEVRAVAAALDGSPALGHAGRVSITDDNSMVAFDSTDTDLVPDDTNSASDAFVSTLLPEAP
ncbi:MULTISPECIES: hypothetical protein [unclassified Streptomyces]|uniref:hypothetical protein n=1 Tax=unclassified Streptomyces TaxID=2593676 RepID=UPI00278C5500|nr:MULTISPECIES: hypothetical protein [unclassified Streptomyces]